ncbi:MAG TPA: TonB-dependent receptor [Rhizomicrobium sp.]|nr:TonB-dependent receptor [Rhizomicrobium sp.]
MRSNFYLKTLLASTVSVVALTSGALAQQQDATAESVTVTGTRIVNGAQSPTPVTAVDASTLLTQSPVSISDALLQLPQFASTVTGRSQVEANGRGFGTPTPGFNLYGLGTIRTLVLMDGNRVPGTFYDTTVNPDMLPQMLVKRVDVVTGGASAVYGSDAVAGVVNYVLDHDFNGFKGVAQGGISTYGDAKSFRLGGAWGAEIIPRGHLEVSAEYTDSDAVPDASTRPFGASSCSLVGNGSTATPYTMACNIRQSNAAPNGLFVNGPAKGMQFSANGQSIVPFNPGTPTTTANANIGGDGGVTHNEGLVPTDHTFQGYARFDYDITKDLSAYVEGRYGINYTIGESQIYTNTDGQYPLQIYSGNAFLTAAEQATLFPNGAASAPVDVARFDNDLMRQLSVRQFTNTNSISFGLKGSTFGDFTWDAHYTHGDNHVTLTTYNNVNSAHLYAALDAVKDVNGNTVCASSITEPGAFPGCAPINLFGQGNASQAAQNYVFQNTYWVAANSMDDVAANLTGTLFQGWAGPVKAAVGVEYRSQALNVTTSTPNDTFNPQGLRLAPYGTYNSGNGGTALTNPTGSYPSSDLAYFKEVQAPGQGSEGISEADVELNAPLLKDLPFAELVSLNTAYRYAQYAASGEGNHSSFDASTWKAGLEWAVNDDIRFRMSESRDMRAPTLWDLYQQQVISTSGITDPLTGQAGSVNTVAGGNPNLKPEVSYNYTAGIVATPSFIPNLTASVDYFHIKINNQIGSIGGLDPTVYKYCQATGLQQYCGGVVRPGAYNDPSPGNFPTLVYNTSQNVSLQEVEGFNAEIDYANDLSSWSSLPGQINTRIFWTHQDLDRQASLPGTLVSNLAGTNAFNGVPRDKVNVTLGYNIDNFGVSVVEQLFGSEQWQASPAQFVYAMPKIPGYALTDLNFTYGFTADEVPATAFVNISNLWNANGPLTGGWTGSPGLLYPTANYADVIGRYFTVGVRVNM